MNRTRSAAGRPDDEDGTGAARPRQVADGATPADRRRRRNAGPDVHRPQPRSRPRPAGLPGEQRKSPRSARDRQHVLQACRVPADCPDSIVHATRRQPESFHSRRSRLLHSVRADGTCGGLEAARAGNDGGRRAKLGLRQARLAQEMYEARELAVAQIAASSASPAHHGRTWDQGNRIWLWTLKRPLVLREGGSSGRCRSQEINPVRFGAVAPLSVK